MSCVRINKFEALCCRIFELKSSDGNCDTCPHANQHKYEETYCNASCPDEDPELDVLFEKSWTDTGRHIIL